MKERSFNEINSSINQGKECVVQAVNGVFSAAKLVNRSIWGEVRFERTDSGAWVARTVKPGIRHLLRR